MSLYSTRSAWYSSALPWGYFKPGVRTFLLLSFSYGDLSGDFLPENREIEIAARGQALHVTKRGSIGLDPSLLDQVGRNTARFVICHAIS